MIDRQLLASMSAIYSECVVSNIDVAKVLAECALVITADNALIEKLSALAAGVPRRMSANTSGETQRQRGKEEFAGEIRDLINEYRNESA